MASEAQAGRAVPAGRPLSLPALIAALARLLTLPPAERARAVAAIGDPQQLLADVRAEAMIEAVTGPGRVSQAALARELGISPKSVSEAISQHRARCGRCRGESPDSP